MSLQLDFRAGCEDCNPINVSSARQLPRFKSAWSTQLQAGQLPRRFESVPNIEAPLG